jgi:hypothetical protein
VVTVYVGEHANARSTLEVPIFWFIHTEPVLLLDKHYQSKSLPNMVLVVQSETSSWETHFQCNGRSLLWDLRSDTFYLVSIKILSFCQLYFMV